MGVSNTHGCVSGLFSPVPKERRSELFDREEELAALTRHVSGGAPLVLCLGVRRVGKTSVVKTFLNESGLPNIYLDARSLAALGYTRQGLYRALSDALTRLRGRFADVSEYLGRVRGIRVGPFGVELDWRKRGTSFLSLLERMEEYAESRGTVFVVAIDEAQDLRLLKGLDLVKLLAYSYDNLRRVKFLLTGSEAGLLYGFLKLDERDAPLYGRARDEVRVERFSREKSLEYLAAGFAEAGISPPEEELERAVEIFDGIPGWLALYGYAACRGRRDALDASLEEAVRTALGELRHIASASELYAHVLRAVSMGHARWSAVKRAVEIWTGRHIYDETLRRVLNKLTSMGILAKEGEEYRFLDPIYRRAAERL
ncbi:AAA family ATPase [Thermoproteus uzoniensis]|uniref:AAA family ATPase n=1 Tax=Thermoproteus uzoniensis TaxID=184117 RepID=UPI0011E515DB|nr:ATP-binding protein [Thermoproteus uzoniensis]